MVASLALAALVLSACGGGGTSSSQHTVAYIPGYTPGGQHRSLGFRPVLAPGQ